MKLYEIGGEMLKIEDMLDTHAQENFGDITDFPHTEYYEGLIGERNEKLLNLACWFKSVKAEVGAYKDEIATLQSKKKVAENKMQWIKDFIGSYIKVGEKIKDGRVALGWRKSEAVEIDEENLDLRNLPLEFKKIVESADKTKLKEALKEGKIFEDIELVSKDNLQIK